MNKDVDVEEKTKEIRNERVDIELGRGRKTGKVEKTGKETDEKEECVIGMSGENP